MSDWIVLLFSCQRNRSQSLRRPCLRKTPPDGVKLFNRNVLFLNVLFSTEHQSLFAVNNRDEAQLLNANPCRDVNRRVLMRVSLKNMMVSRESTICNLPIFIIDEPLKVTLVCPVVLSHSYHGDVLFLLASLQVLPSWLVLIRIIEAGPRFSSGPFQCFLPLYPTEVDFPKNI